MQSSVDRRYLLQAFSTSSVLTRLFIAVRHGVIPWQRLIQRCGRHGSILDIGCGHGLFLHLLKRHYPHMICVGYDHDDVKIRLAINSRRPRALYFLFDRNKEILPGMRFDCVSMVDVLYAIPREDWPATLAFSRECLRPGGTLLLKETIDKPAWKYRLCLFQEHLAIKVLGYTKGQAPTLPSGDVYRRLLSKSGFHLEEDLSLDKGYLWPHHLFMARKV